jgi:hypothetical protein
MQQNTERWMELAKRAAAEQDLAKFNDLIREIDRLLGDKLDRLYREHHPLKPSK